MDNFNFYWNTLLKNIEWIKFSETKAVFLVTVYGVILTIIYANAEKVYKVIETDSYILVLSILTATTSLVSVVFCFRTLNPVLRNKNSSSIIYFGHIQERFDSAEDYHEKSLNTLQNEELRLKQVSNQVYVTSKIAWRKFSSVSWSIRLFLISITLLTVQILIYLF